MKHATLLALLVLTLSIAGTAQLGSTGTIATKVPFDFVAWNTVVPAGECTVQRATMGGPALAIQNFATGKGTFALAIQDGPSRHGSLRARVPQIWRPSFLDADKDR